MKVKILIIRLSSIGDIVLTSLVVRCLKSQLKDAEIHFVTKQQYVCILNSNPYIDKIHVLEENIGDLINELAPENFDYIIDLHHNFRSGRLKRNIRAKAFSVNKLNWQKMLLINFKIHRLPKKHIVDRYLETTAPLQIKNDGKGLDYFIPENDQFKITDLPVQFQKGYIAFVIAGTYATKKLPIEKISEICQKTNFPVILLGGKKEFDEGEKVLSQANGNVLNFAGKINLNKSASLIRDAKMVLTNDTGLMHIAAAFKKKILSFWGNTVADFGMEPYQPNPASKHMEVENLKCRPCSKLGYQKCPKKHFKCMNEINVDEAVKWIEGNW